MELLGLTLSFQNEQKQIIIRISKQLGFKALYNLELKELCSIFERMKTINILDCTLRDGGYYNNWDFPKTLVNDYLKAISDSGIKNVEIGFRSLKENKLNGPNFFN